MLTFFSQIWRLEKTMKEAREDTHEILQNISNFIQNAPLVEALDRTTETTETRNTFWKIVEIICIFQSSKLRV